MDVDDALRQLGTFSKWQLRSYLVYAFGFGVPLAWMWMGIVFIGDTPNYRCALPENATVNESIPRKCDDNGICSYDKCQMYSNTSNKGDLQDCDNGYWYDPESGYDSTLVSEFDLVCGKNYLVEVSMAISGAGAILGAIVFPYLSDAYGRRKIFLGCMWTNIVIALIQAFSVNIWMFAALGFIDGFQQQGMMLTAVVLAMELFPTEQRTFAGAAIEFFWAFGYVTLVPFAYFIRNWRHLQIAITVPLVLTIVFYWYIFESVPWLVSTGQIHEAERILHKAAKFNGINLPSNILTKDQPLMEKNGSITIESKNKKGSTEFVNGNQKFSEDGKKKGKGILGFAKNLQDATTKDETATEHCVKYTLLDIFRHKKLALYSVVQWFIWFVNSMGYNAMALTVTYLPGNRYLNFFLYAIMEVPAYIVMWLSLHYIGRRITVCVSHIIGGVSLVCMIVQIYDPESKLTALTITLSVLGKMGYTISFGSIFVHCPELYPTTIRNQGFGICGMFSKAAALIAPYFRVLTRQKPELSPLIIGSVSIVAGLLVLILPETRYEPLPETIEELNNFQRKLNKPQSVIK